MGPTNRLASSGWGAELPIIGARYDDPTGSAAYSAQLTELADRVDAVDVDDRDSILTMTADLREQYDRFTAV